MSLRPILTWPDPVLAQVCVPVPEITDEVRALAADMLDTMYHAPGRGLAAPQVGVMSRLFVMDVAWKDGDPEPRIVINPEIVEVAGEMEEADEGCLSIPGISAPVRRPARVRMVWTDLEGQVQEEWLDGFAARCAQHEMDHLDGIVTFDRVDGDRRADLIAAYEAA